MPHGDLIYDSCWLNDAISFATTSRAGPIHVYAIDTDSPASVRRHVTLRGINHLDEMASAFSLVALADGRRIVAGYKKCLRVFDVNRPDRQVDQIECVARKKGGVPLPSQPGLISCVAQSPHNADVLLVGAYTGTVGVYSLGTLRGCQSITHAHTGGVTHICCDPCNEWRTYTGARVDPFVHVWDSRMPQHPVASLDRPVRTNQRVHFDVTSCGKFIVSGSSTGRVDVWSTDAIDKRSVDDFKPIAPTMSIAGSCSQLIIRVHFCSEFVHRGRRRASPASAVDCRRRWRAHVPAAHRQRRTRRPGTCANSGLCRSA